MPHSKTMFCLGSLVTLRWSVTAAHCFEKSAGTGVVTLIGKTTATAGATTTKIPSDPDELARQHIQVRKVKTVFIHTMYDSAPLFRHDIAMVQFEQSFELTDFIGIITLPRYNETANCTSGFFAGWGVSFAIQQTLQCGFNLTISSYEDCLKAWTWEYVPHETMCTEVRDDGTDPCDEDAGGPLMCSQPPVPNLIIGIYSKNKGCGIPKQLTLYIKVDAYLAWIDNTMRNSADRSIRSTSFNQNIMLVLLVLLMLSRSFINIKL